MGKHGGLLIIVGLAGLLLWQYLKKPQVVAAGSAEGTFSPGTASQLGAISPSVATGFGGQFVGVSQTTNEVLVKYPDGSEAWLKAGAGAIQALVSSHPEWAAMG